jgi:hypothetical protein
MKKYFYLVGCFMFFITTTVIGQKKSTEVVTATEIDKADVPVEVIGAVQKDFPGGEITGYYSVPGEVVTSDWDVTKLSKTKPQKVKHYELVVKGAGFNVKALYDKSGNLLWITEQIAYDDLPASVKSYISQDEPGFTVVSNSVKQKYTKKKENTVYIVKINKGKDNKTLYFDKNGKHMMHITTPKL